jgi:zinc/manganese transport system substrate-binding protein
MHRRTLLAALPLTLAGLPGARGTPSLRVVATFSVLADMVQTVAGPLAAVTSLVRPDGDVHMYEPRPADVRAVMAAGVLVRNGLGLEGWMARLTKAAAFRGITVTAAETVTPRIVRAESGAMATDPHAWQDPRNAELYVAAIAQGLATADPDRAADVHAAADRYTAAIRDTDAWIAARFAPIPAPRRRVITTHDAFGYYGARYGIEFLAAEGLSTESEPSARTIAALVAQIRREQVKAVFLENMTDPRLAQMLVRETGVHLGGTVYSDALSGPQGPAPTYLAMLRHNTTLLAAAMRDG